jgi:hypothetical protein
VYTTSHTRIRTGRTIVVGDQARTVRVARPGCATDRRRAIREQLEAAR